jgi:hypothetical protein
VEKNADDEHGDGSRDKGCIDRTFHHHHGAALGIADPVRAWNPLRSGWQAKFQFDTGRVSTAAQFAVAAQSGHCRSSRSMDSSSIWRYGGAYAPPLPNFHTGMPSFRALSARFS